MLLRSCYRNPFVYSQVVARRIWSSGGFYGEAGDEVVVRFDVFWVLFLFWLYTTLPAPNLLNSCLFYMVTTFLKSGFLTVVAFPR